MKQLFTFFMLFLVSVAYTQGTEAKEELLFDQPYFDGGTAVTTAVDDAADTDFEAAENFFDVDGTIEEVVIYGLTLLFDGGWGEEVPDDTEPFILRFYNYEEDFVEGLEAPTTGTYELVLQDSFDHWDWGAGSFVSVFVNGNLVIEDATMESGDPDPKYYTFDATAGDEISTVYVPGDFSSENYYAIIDPDENIIAEEGGTWDTPGESTPGSIAPGGMMPLEPDWANPLSTQHIDADVEVVGPVWDNTYTLYKVTMNLDDAMDMGEGWVSAQIDANNGSGTWFLWMNSEVGDGQAWHRTEPVEGVKRGIDHPAFASISDEAARFYRDQLDHDLAIELWADTEDDDPIDTPTGSDCTDPIVVDAFPYEDLGQTTCGMENTYFNTCLGSYDGGEDIHYQFTLTEEQLVTITMDPQDTGWTGMLLTDVCPPPADNCIATSTGASGIREIEEVLEPGTYYIMISTWPTPDCIPDFDLTITAEAPPEPPIPPGDLLFSQELDQGGGFFTSTYDPLNEVDFEIADNFFDLNDTRGENIDIVEFYGQYLDFAEGAWIPVDPEETEPFWVRFYEYVEDFVPGLEAPETGTYELELRDAADHWDWGGGSFVTVYVDGVAVIEDATMVSGDPDPKYYTFSANQGDEITTIYTPGSWASENYYAIIDPSNNVIAEEGGTAADPGLSVPGNIEGGQVMALEPDWDNPVYEGVIDADVEYTGLDDDIFDDPIWKFTVELPEGLSMTEGWVSPQLDAENASGDAWFLYNTSLEGDGLSYRRDGEAKNIVFERGQDYHLSGRYEGFERFIGREALDEDFAFSLFTKDDDEEPAPIPLSGWALYLSILSIGLFIFVRFRKMM